jgi:hypothetical protein
VPAIPDVGGGGLGLRGGFLTVLEEIPGFVHWADMTAHLAREGYWAR